MGSGEIAVDDERLRELITLLRQAFPDQRCLRCSCDRLYVRGYLDPSLRPGFSMIDVIETTCTRCGMVETHRAALLSEAVTNGQLPVAADVR